MADEGGIQIERTRNYGMTLPEYRFYFLLVLKLKKSNTDHNLSDSICRGYASRLKAPFGI